MFRINLHNLFESKQLKEELFVNEVFKDKTSELLRNKEPGQEHEHKKPPATAKLNEHNFKVEQTKDIEARDHPPPRMSKTIRPPNTTTPGGHAQSYHGSRRGSGPPPAATPRNKRNPTIITTTPLPKL